MHVNESKVFAKQAHLFAHRKAGAQHRFEKKYVDLKNQVELAWTADLLKMEEELSLLKKSNQALAHTKSARLREMAEKTAREVMRTVFNEWRQEMNRIVSDLCGYPQEDGNILFPDASIAKMPKGLWIAPENLIKLAA
jgi:hypothetical protein